MELAFLNPRDCSSNIDICEVNGQDVGDTELPNETFVGDAGAFERTSHEILLSAPVYLDGQSSYHSSRRRSRAEFRNESVMQLRILSYTNWVNQWSASANANASCQHARQFNPIIQVARFMQVNVSDSVQLRPCPTLFSTPRAARTSHSARRFPTPSLKGLCGMGHRQGQPFSAWSHGRQYHHRRGSTPSPVTVLA